MLKKSFTVTVTSWQNLLKSFLTRSTILIFSASSFSLYWLRDNKIFRLLKKSFRTCTHQKFVFEFIKCRKRIGRNLAQIFKNFYRINLNIFCKKFLAKTYFIAIATQNMLL